MTISKKLTGSVLDITLKGRLDTSTAPDLDDVLKANLDGVPALVFDFEHVDYISSAGLRLLLPAQKRMNRQGTMKIRNVREQIMEIFDVTGFSDILTIE